MQFDPRWFADTQDLSVNRYVLSCNEIGLSIVNEFYLNTVVQKWPFF